ncbi:MAG: Uma2 family endonuclease [Xanthomonadales bacterium]|nr:Uma2 family endonuclease [Xanthomonadales bacterium]
MSRPADEHRFGAAEFLEWEAAQPVKHEFVDGEVFAMAGASDAHVTIALNLAIALRNHFRGGPCSVFIPDMKLRVEADDAYYYPDVFVSCAESDRAHTHWKAEPVFVAEVLSPSTSANDRGCKFASYRKLASLAEYAVIDTERQAVDLFRRMGDGSWLLFPIEGGGTLELASLKLRVPLDELYVDVRLDPPTPGPDDSVRWPPAAA